MKKRTAHKIWKRFSLFPTQYTLEQIKEAHFVLGKKIDPDLIEEWKELNGLGGITEEIRKNVGIVDVVIKAGPDGFIGTEDDIITIEKAQPIYTPETSVQFVSVGVHFEEKMDTTLTTTCIDYSKMRVTELKNCCRQLGLKGFSTLKKKELIALLVKERTVSYAANTPEPGLPEKPKEKDS